MKIEEAIKELEGSILSGGTKAEHQLKQRFLNILDELKHKDLDPSQVNSLEQELHSIFVHDTALKGDKKQLKRSLDRFVKFLQKECSLVPEGYCAANGMIFGMLAGALVLAFSIGYFEFNYRYYSPLGGLLLGVAIGSICDRRRKRQGRTLLTRMY